MFLTPRDKATHRRAVSIRQKLHRLYAAEASTIENPEQLVAFILEQARTQYRRGEHHVHCTLEVPVKNFHAWGAMIHVIHADDEDLHIRQLLRRELLRQGRNSLREAVTPGFVSEFECRYEGPSFTFEVRLSLSGI